MGGCPSGVCSLFCEQRTADGMRISDWTSDVCSSDLIDSDPAALTDAESARAEALTAEGNVIEADYEDAEELPAEVAARLEAIDEEWFGRASARERVCQSV